MKLEWACDSRWYCPHPSAIEGVGWMKCGCRSSWPPSTGTDGCSWEEQFLPRAICPLPSSLHPSAKSAANVKSPFIWGSFPLKAGEVYVFLGPSDTLWSHSWCSMIRSFTKPLYQLIGTSPFIYTHLMILEPRLTCMFLQDDLSAGVSRC